MKTIGLLLTCLGAIFCGQQASAQTCSKTKLVVEKMIAHHLEPLAIDDSLSVRIFELAFGHFDPDGYFFSLADVEALSSFRLQIDDEIKTGSCGFENALRGRLLLKISKARAKADSILKAPISFQLGHTIELSEDEAFPETEADLLKQLHRKIKLEILNKAFQKFRFADTTMLTPAALERLIPETQEKVRGDRLKAFDHILAELNKPENFKSAYLRLVANTFDPHSDYFTLKTKSEFDEALSDDRLSLGLDIAEDEFGKVKVSRLMPGGPAWKSGQIHVGDVPVSITWAGTPPVNLIDLDFEEIDELLHKQGATTATIVLLRKTGEQTTVQLIKEKVQNTDNSVEGFVLNGDRKIGYIHLPGFFVDTDGGGANRCANEVAKQILKLNKFKIEGLILDLRGNGGGSIGEAVDLAGAFIDVGPMAIATSKGSLPETIKDFNRGAAYSGPLVVLVNGLSTSASELVAAALQDYNRAIIVGSRTFGKATGQEVIPLFEGANKDFLKVTVDRLYRITQKSLQMEGVTPDIILPQVGAALVETERDMPYALFPKTIEKKAYFNLFALPNFSLLREQSKARLETNESLAAVTQINKLMGSGIPLHTAGFVDFANHLDKAFKTMNHPNIKAPFKVQSSEPPTGNTFSNQQSGRMAKEIQTSPYVIEAFHIICDFISSKVK